MLKMILSKGLNYDRPAARAALILLALLVVCFLPFVAGNKTFLESSREVPSVMPYGSWAGAKVPMMYLRTHDAAAPAFCAEPWLELIKKEYIDDKTLPVWNPYQAFGTPLAANMQSQVFNPVTVAFALIHTPRTYNWYILLRLFVAGFFAYLYIRFFVSFMPALAAGVTSMLGGYYILFITMPHLSVEVLLPAALFVSERIIRTPKFQTAAWFAILIFFVLVGGMPESSLLLLSLTFTYILFRIATDQSLRSTKSTRSAANQARNMGANEVHVLRVFPKSPVLNRFKYLFVATCAGIAFSAVLLLPFRQFLRYSYDVHQFSNTRIITGLLHDSLDLSVFTYIFPFLYGPSGEGYICANYAGLISFFLIIIAFAGLSWRRTDNDRRLSLLTCFFGLVVVVVISKRYGFPLINWVGSLPLFNLVIFDKYEEPLISIAVSMLCAIGLERLCNCRMPPLKQVLALALSFLLIPTALILSKAVVPKETTGLQSLEILSWAVFLPAFLLVVLSLALILLDSAALLDKWGAARVSLTLSLCVLVLLSCETVFNYIVPTYYVWNSLPTVASNPYAGAPFVKRLQQWAGNNRIFAADAILHPDWPSAFGLFDIRDIDAMYFRRYLPFIESFFRLGPHPIDGNELKNRFTGAGGADYSFNNYLQRRLLQLSSAKYVITMPNSSLASQNNVIDQIMQRKSAEPLLPGEGAVSRAPLDINGIVRTAIGGQAPYRLPYRLQVDNTTQTFHFSYGINPAAFTYACGDGATFVIEAKDESGAAKQLFSSFINPEHNASVRYWIEGTLDLSAYLGKQVELAFITNGGPNRNVCGDWAYWSDLGSKDQDVGFKLVYKHEVEIFEDQHVLPRAAVFYQATVRQNETAVLNSLGDLSFDVFGSVLLSKADLDSSQTEWLSTIAKSPDQALEEARIVSYAPREVTVEASLQKRGILVLNDTNFPGWLVSVDGAPGRIVDANYLFRGVFLEPGKHVVKFSYKPWSVALGGTISAASFSGFAVFGLIRAWKRRRRSAEAALIV